MEPSDLQYTEEHEWIRQQGGRAMIGITDYAKDALGDIVYVQLPAVGTEVSAGQPMGEVESTKSVSDIYAPLTGTVVERNEELDKSPELVNTDPYGSGWMVVVEAAGSGETVKLLDAQAYSEMVGGQGG